MQRYIFILFILLCTSNLQAADLRNWTGSNGKVIEAEFVSYDKDNEIVVIKRADGKEQRVKLSLFSDKDQDYVKNGGKENTENPFGENVESTKKIIRIRLSIDEYGEGNIQIEKTDQPAKNDFDGSPITLPSIPKAKVLKGKNGLIKITHDFADPDPVEAWIPTGEGALDMGISLNSIQKVLEMKPCIGLSKDILVSKLWCKRFFKLPLTVVIEFLENKDSEQIQLAIRKIADLQDYRMFRLVLDHTNQNSLRIEVGWGNGRDKDQILLLEESIHLNKIWEGNFRLPLPNTKITDRFQFDINYGFIPKTSKEIKALQISKLELTSRFIPTLGVGFDETNATIFVKLISLDGSAKKSGIQQGDAIKTINDKEPKSIQEAVNIITDSIFGNDITIKVERRGEEKKIVVKAD